MANLPLKLVSLFLSSFILWLATSIIFRGHNTLHCLTLHTTLLFGLHYVVVRSGFVVSFLSNSKNETVGSQFSVWISKFPFAHKTSFFGLVFRGFPRAHKTLFFDPVFRFSTRAHNLVFGRTHYFVFRPHIFRSSTQLGFGPHELFCFSVFFSRTQYFIWWLSISDIYHNSAPLSTWIVGSFTFPFLSMVYSSDRIL